MPAGVADPGQLKRATRAGSPMTRALVVWQWTDGKRGHERQCEGLVQALAERRQLDHHVLPVPSSPFQRLRDFLVGGPPTLRSLPRPDLILGAGRACALPLLAARRAFGGKAICIMRPQLPRAWFDLCVIPRHDGVAAGDKVVVTEGPMNPMRPAAQREADFGVLLLGGPSIHHAWNEDALFAQIDQVLAARPDMQWLATDSRRTPTDLSARLTALGKVEFHSHRTTPPAWLPALLGRAQEAWVSADSVSMIFEALSAGARVGVLAVPTRRIDRITAIADDLLARGLVMSPQAAPSSTSSSHIALREAERVASLILSRWPMLGADA